MAWLQVLAKAAPALGKQLPKLWPLLLESRNRQWLVDTARDLSNQSPRKRMRARVELTAALADSLAAKADDEEERQLAAAWTRRARNLGLRLEMPVQGRQHKREHLKSVQAQLDELQSEMNAHLLA